MPSKLYSTLLTLVSSFFFRSQWTLPRPQALTCTISEQRLPFIENLITPTSSSSTTTSKRITTFTLSWTLQTTETCTLICIKRKTSNPKKFSVIFTKHAWPSNTSTKTMSCIVTSSQRISSLTKIKTSNYVTLVGQPEESPRKGFIPTLTLSYLPL